MPTTTSGLTGSASADLGINTLPKQSLNETDEERRKRLMLQQQRSLGPASMSLGLGYGG